MKQKSIICMIIAILTSPAFAILTDITGFLYFDSVTINYFNPVNGCVPEGSSGIQPEAIIYDPDGTYVEFMFLNDFSGINVDIDATTLLVHQFPADVEDTANSWDIYISGIDPDIEDVVVDSTIPELTWSLFDVGDGIQISYPGGYIFGPTSYPDGWYATLTLIRVNEPPIPDEVLALIYAQDAIEELLPQSLKSVKKADDLMKKINIVLLLIESEDYAEALEKLKDDIIKRTDGCAETLDPDKNDWILTCEAQDEVYPLILEAITILEDLI